MSSSWNKGEEPFAEGRVRRGGGGRKGAAVLDAGLVPALLALVEPDGRGDPGSPLRWTAKSLRHLAGELARQGHLVSAPTVGSLLRDNGFSLQGNAKTLEGDQHPDGDAQFRYVNAQARDHQVAGGPVISVDTKKREQLGRLPVGGRERKSGWHRCHHPRVFTRVSRRAIARRSRAPPVLLRIVRSTSSRLSAEAPAAG